MYRGQNAGFFIQNAHGYENADRSIWTPVLTALTTFGKQRTEYLLIDVAGHFTKELVVPS